MCFKIIDAVMQVSLLVVIAVDDLQSNKHQTESNILLQLLEQFPRLCVITTETPFINLSPESFMVSGASSGKITGQLCELFSYFSDKVETPKVTPVETEKRVQTQVFSDIMSVSSCRSDQASNQPGRA